MSGGGGVCMCMCVLGGGACSLTQGGQRKPCDEENVQQTPEGSAGTSDVITSESVSQVAGKGKGHEAGK